MPEVLTAPVAIIKVDGTPIGKMRNVRVSETIRRGRVTGIGRANASELPVLEYTGTINCSFYTIRYDLHPMLYRAILRKTNTAEAMLNTLLLQEIGLKIDFIRKVADKTGFPPEGRDTDNIIQTVEETFATIEDAFITSDGYDINEGQISGRDSTFEFTSPIHFLK